MPDSPSASAPDAGQVRALAATLAWPGRLALLLLNYIPLLQALAVAACLLAPPLGWGPRTALAVAMLYLVPPLVARLLRLAVPLREGTIAAGSAQFLAWWALLQLQALFCRFPALEEGLRVVPSLYSNWLRLWGARVGRLTFWGSGTRILDRTFLDIGDDVVFAAGVRLNAHVLARAATGELQLLLGTIRIGHRVVVGGYSLLTAGSRIADDETPPALLVLPPFSTFRDGRRCNAGKSMPTEGRISA